MTILIILTPMAENDTGNDADAVVIVMNDSVAVPPETIC